LAVDSFAALAEALLKGFTGRRQILQRNADRREYTDTYNCKIRGSKLK
jgi:hypothetical protein